MNEDVFNASLRRFLKKGGITSQREIEKAVRDALEAGRLKGHEKLPAKMVLTLGGVSLTHEITDEIELGSTGRLILPATGSSYAGLTRVSINFRKIILVKRDGWPGQARP